MSCCPAKGAIQACKGMAAKVLPCNGIKRNDPCPCGSGKKFKSAATPVMKGSRAFKGPCRASPLGYLRVSLEKAANSHRVPSDAKGALNEGRYRLRWRFNLTHIAGGKLSQRE